MALIHNFLDELSAVEHKLIALLPTEHHAAVRDIVSQAADRSRLHAGEPVETKPQAQPLGSVEPTGANPGTPYSGAQTAAVVPSTAAAQPLASI